MPLEIAIDSVRDAVAALPFADRIELCRDLSEHGLTPAPQLVREVRGKIDANRKRVELVVLVRPVGTHRLGEADAETCLRQIAESLDAGADAVAVGALESDGGINLSICERFVQACGGKPAVFHRAFDFAHDRVRAAAALIELGFARVLSAGVASFDHSRCPLTQRLDAIGGTVRASGGRLRVVSCGGVRAGNAPQFAAVTPELHSSCRVEGQFDAGEAGRIRASISGTISN